MGRQSTLMSTSTESNEMCKGSPSRGLCKCCSYVRNVDYFVSCVVLFLRAWLVAWMLVSEFYCGNY